MTIDPFDSLHGPRRPAPPGGADLAITAGRRRLYRRRTAAASGVSLAVVAGAALAGAGGGDSRGLTPADGATGAPGSATPTPTLPVPVPSPSIPAVPTLPPLPGTSSPTAEPTAAPEPTEEPTPERGEFIGISDRTITTTMRNDPTACTARPAQAAAVNQSGFCTILTGPAEVTPGDRVTLSMSLCRPGGLPARTVTYDSGYEVVVNVARVTDAGETEVWAWAHQDDFAPERRTVTFNPGDCRTWTVTWRGQDNDGYALAAGSYQVNGYPVAYDWTHEDGDDAMGPSPEYYTVRVG